MAKNKLSPYLNPNWPEAVWDVSGAFVNDRELISFFDFCKTVLDFEPFHIVHGAPLCTWNSGRVVKQLLRDAEEIRTAGLAYEQRKIALYLTFTNLYLGEKELANQQAQAMLQFARNHNATKKNSVILASDTLRRHLRAEYPELKLVSSILKITNSHGKGKLDAYRQLEEDYDEVMMHPDDVLNYEMLEKIENKDKYILLINEYCIRNCPLRPLHYDALSKQALDFFGYNSSDFEKKQNLNGCRNLFTLLQDEKKNVLALSTAEIKTLYDMGFRHFKLQGRGHANAFAILNDLMRLCLRQDAETENAIHLLGQRFFESLLADKQA